MCVCARSLLKCLLTSDTQRAFRVGEHATKPSQSTSSLTFPALEMDDNPTPLSAVAAETLALAETLSGQALSDLAGAVVASSLFRLPPRASPSGSGGAARLRTADDWEEDDDGWSDGDDDEDDDSAYFDYDSGGLVDNKGEEEERARVAGHQSERPAFVGIGRVHPLRSQASSHSPRVPPPPYMCADVSDALQESLDVQTGAGAGGAVAAVSSSGASGHSAPASSSSATAVRHSNRQPAPLRQVAAQPREHQLDKYRDKINLGAIEDLSSAGVVRHTGRDDRATTEQVMDPRTRLILFKLLNSGFISAINGCISTGKEANVYHAVSGDGRSFAVKIYKTSILVFKDRDRYVSGEFRFRSGYSRSNPRKMVRLWAEKEMRNLKRLHAAGFNVPFPQLLRSHVLVMDFFGDNGWPSPRLRDAGLSPSKLADAYMEVVDAMRGMYQTCRLVHADLSEYNMLVHEGKICVIDVSQSVETDHPRALEFLRMDCQNVTDYFRREGVVTMTPRELFDYVVHASLPTREAEQAYLDEMRSRAEARLSSGGGAGGDGGGKAAEDVENAVFMAAYIPQSLFAVRDAEAETRKVIEGKTGDLYYAALAGLEAGPGGPASGATTAAAFAQAQGKGKGGAEAGGAKGKAAKDKPRKGGALAGEEAEDGEAGEEGKKKKKGVSWDAAPASNAGAATAPGPDVAVHAEESDSSDSGDSDNDSETDSDDEDDEDEEGGGGKSGAPLSRHDMSKEEWKKVKAAAKEAKREKRKTKIPKKVKKRHAKVSSGRK
jgi:RIO kinase 1